MPFSNITPLPTFEPIKTIGRRFQNLTGQRFTRLLVLGLAGRHKERTHWYCICICGTFLWASRQNLQTGNTKSCGCLQREVTFKRSFVHGQIRTSEWYSWVNMIDRCTRPSHIGWADYGGRGIKVHDGWLGKQGFVNFFDYVGPKPTRFHSIDRINNNGNYEPNNVRWATKKEQSRNRRSGRYITFQGRTRLLVEWAEDIGISGTTMHNRLKKHPLEIALTMPKHHENLTTRKH